MMTPFYLVAGITAILLLVGAGMVHVIPKLGRPGRAVSEALCRAPLLDLVITYFVAVPLIAGPIAEGWAGLAGGLAGQAIALFVWIFLHELAHPTARRGPRIYRVLDGVVGAWRNHTALWVTALGVPILWVVRVQQLVVYPLLILLLKFPTYRQSEWVNLSRHKFEGLIGYDLIWCLYCDWMTGVWSLGTEMLRNVESFWCPIQFASGKKCENCKLDFPDVAHGWVKADGTMADVVVTLKAMHLTAPRSWFGHPERLSLEVIVPGPRIDAGARPSEGPLEPAGNVEALAATLRTLASEDRARLAALLGEGQ